LGKKISVSCLPAAGMDNPYQHLMMKGLQADGRLSVRNGIHDRFCGILRTAAVQRPDYIHFDWETGYYYRRKLWMTLLNIPFFVLQVYMVRYIFNCTLVWTPHNIIPHDARYLRIHRFCRRFFARQMKWIRLFSELSIQNAVKEFRCSDKKFKIIPEGSYVEYYPNTISRKEARSLLNIPENRNVILYLGLIKPYKGITTLIKSFLKSFNGNCLLVIAGRVMDTNYLESVKNIINENVILKDSFIKEGDLQVYFNAADVVALPFEKIENSGTAILAMGFKKAVIAPKMGVLTERLGNQVELLYEHSLEESFKILKRLDKGELQQMGENNFHALLKYKWSDFAKAF
jgi:glycosyltransferase involved in cell wall biosynthesis